MAGAAEQQGGLYRIGLKGKLAFAAGRVRVLEDAVIPPPNASSDRTRSYGWIAGALPSPSRGDRYIVEFVSKDCLRIIAYIDRFARVFTTDRPIIAPPAREPDLMFACAEDDLSSGEDDTLDGFCTDAAVFDSVYSDDDAFDDSCETGVVEVGTSISAIIEPAAYRCRKGRYDLLESWHAFGAHGTGLTLEDALARAYLAFVYRPAVYGTPLFERGLKPVLELLLTEGAGAAMSHIVAIVKRADADPALSAPPIVRCLSQSLQEADIDGSVLSGHDASAVGLRLVRTAGYADTIYLAADEGSSVSQRTIWALEAALNRCLLAAELLGARAAEADAAECSAAQEHVMASIGVQVADIDEGREAKRVSEWDVRVAIASAIERLRLPYRIETEFRLDASAGMAALAVIVPDASIMPRSVWSEAEGMWKDVPDADRITQAVTYAMRVCILLAAIAFSASPLMKTVVVSLKSLDLEDASDPTAFLRALERGEIGPASIAGSTLDAKRRKEGSPACTIAFDRYRFCADNAYRKAAEGDPADFLGHFGASVVDADDYDPFATIKSLPSYAIRADMPEVGFCALLSEAREALGAPSIDRIRIFDKAERRRVAEGLASRISRATSASESVALVRETQNATGDPLVHDGCMRLMAALAEGSIDTSDQNEVVNVFLGDDPFLAAVIRARKAMAASKWNDAVVALKGVIAESDAEGRFADSTEVVHRVFDTYASRIVYNLARARALPWIEKDLDIADAGSEANVELAPDSLYTCCLHLTSLLERAPDHVEEALGYGQRCMRMAPTIAAGYRQTARVYMAANRYDEARSVLVDCLRIAVWPEDASVAYYQIAFAEWNLGHTASAVAAYLKALELSPVVAPQATVELRRLVSESGAPLIDDEDVDEALRHAGIPIIPEDDLVAALDRAIAAAVNIDAFSVAHSLLTLRLRRRPDDALANVALSLT